MSPPHRSSRWSCFFAAVFLFSFCLNGASASVTIALDAQPRPHKGTQAVTSAKDLFRQSCPNEFDNKFKIVLSSFNTTASIKDLHASSDSFVRGAIQAWAEHSHFVIRPDEVWFSILTQMNFYMNNHSEEIRHLFVDFEGKEIIHVMDWTWYDALSKFKDAIQSRVKTDWLMDWVMPNFSTTTDSDIMTANVLMMGLMQKYFDYVMSIVCGIPSITLLGEQKDWESLLAKLDRLDEFGPEPAQYKQRLKPILTRFVKTFKEPDSNSTRLFWNQIVHADPQHMCGAPPYTLSGWIMGFQFWDAEGHALNQWYNDNVLKLDGVSYPTYPIDDLPLGYAKAPITLIEFDGKEKWPGWVVAGNFGKRITTGAPPQYRIAMQRANKRRDQTLESRLSEEVPLSSQSTLQPWSGWFLYGPSEPDAKNLELKRSLELNNLTNWISSNGGTQGACGTGVLGAMEM